MALLDDVRKYAADDIGDIDQNYIDSAEAYLTNAGVTMDETKPLYCLLVKMIVTNWYDNRVPAGTVAAQPLGIDGIITQLKYSGGGTIASGTA